MPCPQQTSAWLRLPGAAAAYSNGAMQLDVTSSAGASPAPRRRSCSPSGRRRGAARAEAASSLARAQGGRPGRAGLLQLAALGQPAERRSAAPRGAAAARARWCLPRRDAARVPGGRRAGGRPRSSSPAADRARRGRTRASSVAARRCGRCPPGGALHRRHRAAHRRRAGAPLGAAVGAEQLAFYDAIAPIVAADSIDWDRVRAVALRQGRDGRGYVNCPLDAEQYERFVDALLRGEKVTPHALRGAALLRGLPAHRGHGGARARRRSRSGR